MDFKSKTLLYFVKIEKAKEKRLKLYVFKD